MFIKLHEQLTGFEGKYKRNREKYLAEQERIKGRYNVSENGYGREQLARLELQYSSATSALRRNTKAGFERVYRDLLDRIDVYLQKSQLKESDWTRLDLFLKTQPTQEEFDSMAEAFRGDYVAGKILRQYAKEAGLKCAALPSVPEFRKALVQLHDKTLTVIDDWGTSGRHGNSLFAKNLLYGTPFRDMQEEFDVYVRECNIPNEYKAPEAKAEYVAVNPTLNPHNDPELDAVFEA